MIPMMASIPLPLCRAGPRSPRVPTCVPGGRRARPLPQRAIAAEQVGEPQAADLLHLAQGGAQLLLGRAPQPARQLAGHRRRVAAARGQHEREAEARAVLRVELRQPEPLARAQAREARGALLALRLGAQRAPLQLAARQVRVAAQDALLACGEAQTDARRQRVTRRGQGARGSRPPLRPAASGAKPRPRGWGGGSTTGCPAGARRPARPPLKQIPTLAPLRPSLRPQPRPGGGAGSDKSVL